MPNENVQKKLSEETNTLDVDKEINQWCKLTPKSSENKSIDDIEIDAWCDNKSDIEVMNEKKKMRRL